MTRNEEMDASVRNIDQLVCILAAGSGTRMGPYGESLNKCLLPWKGKALLTHLVEKFPADTRFVVALGHRAQQVKDYARLAHPEANIEFVEVEPHTGPGSGPGRSLLACREHLKSSFYFVACDTMWSGPPPPPSDRSWAAIAAVPRSRLSSYCNMQSRAGRVTRVFEKKDPNADATEAFVGLAFFAHPSEIWKPLEDAASDSPNETQMTTALSALCAAGELDSVNLPHWRDFGTAELYESILAEDGDFDFSKRNESIYFTGRKVIKFFADERITERRCARAAQNPDVFPRIRAHAHGFYCYDWQPGRTLYESFTPTVFRRLLEWMPERLWLPREVPDALLSKACFSFYRDKSLARIRESLDLCAHFESCSMINSEEVPPLSDLAARIPWDSLAQGAVPTFIHGDLQPDNILVREDGQFLLLDWRQDFGEELSFGDVYYDLAKLQGGIELLYAAIKKSDFTFRSEGGEITFRLPQHPGQNEIRNLYSDFLAAKGYSHRRVDLLNALIYCNMAPLHQPPFRELLYALGRLSLYRELKRGEWK